MRLISFEVGGRAGFGVVKNEGIIDLSRHTKFASLKELLQAGALAELAELVTSLERDFGLDDVQLLPPIPDPGKIICVGLNYAEHVAESGRTVTEKPALFPRYPESQVGHLAPMIKPLESDKLDYEGELAVVIGKGGRRIKESDALDYVAGYSCYNDGSVRDWQHHTSQFMPGKSFVGTGAFGPWIVTADEIPDPKVMRLRTLLNGQVMQSATVDMMITSIPAQIAYISTFMPLQAGDVIVTGTPGGVGVKRNPPVFMKAGDTIEIEIDKIGTLRNPVVAEVR
ncbi:MAG: hydrolase family protein [Herminiimonas sp.]|nr:hydrolase family protein [Herminiimonas sp.]